MNPYALPSIIAFVLLVLLAVGVIFQNPRDKRNRLLFAFCLVSALSAGTSAMLHLSVKESEAIFWNKWPYIFAIPSFYFATELILQFAGRARRLKERLFGQPITVHCRIVYLLLIATWVTTVLTDLIIAPPYFFNPTGWEHRYGPLFSLVILFALYFLACLIFILYKGIKSTSDHIAIRARIISLLALTSFMVFTIIVGAVLPFAGLQTHSLAPLAYIVMCFLLTYGLLKMQWETIQDLKHGLEEKVLSRTRELRDANRSLREAQAELIRSERMAALGELSKGVAHAVRNPIMSIGGFTRRLKKKLPSDNPASEYIDLIIEEATSLEKMVADVGDYTSMPEPQLREARLSFLMDQTINDWKKEDKTDSLRFEMNLLPEDPMLSIDVALLSRALRNVFYNAKDALPAGEETVSVDTWTEGSSLVISIRDRGRGIDQKHKKFVFDPFFTTKTNGSGLGLTRVNRIVKGHEGRVEFLSSPDAGTEVRIFLPLKQE